MPITAQTFRIEHFENLTRGLEAAHGAFEQLEAERDLARTTQDATAKANSALQDELEARPTVDAWEELVELVEDVGRNVRTLDELLDYVRERCRL